MRGVAALGVVCLHGEALFGAATPHSAYLAVDFFFVLSGFIMAHVYADALDRGLTARAFMRARLVRLYPLYLASVLCAVALAAGSLLSGNGVLWDGEQPAISAPFAMLMLPSPATVRMFPLDIPAWSLLLEVIANIAFAVWWFRRRSALLLTAAVAASALVAMTVIYGSMDFGSNKDTGLWGLARVFLSFPVGVLVYRIHRRVRVPFVSAVSVLPVVLLVALLFAAPTGGSRIVFDLGFVLIAAPLLVLAGAAAEPSSLPLARLYVALGAMSYPLYILHYQLLATVAGRLAHQLPPGLVSIAAGCVVVAGLVLISGVASILDSRLRRAINGWLRRPERRGVPA